MSAKIMGLVWDLKLSPAERIVLLAMADHADHDGDNIWPSIGRLAWKTDYSERQVKRIIKDLRDAGILVVTQGATPSTPNHYRINLAAGIQKEAYKTGKNKNKRGDILTPRKRGDILTPGDIAMSPPGDTGDTPRGDIAMSPKPSWEPSMNHEREKRTPKQANMDTFHEAVVIYKELSGKRTVAPVVATLIASRVTDMDLWRRVVTACCKLFNPGNTDVMLDWYEHPEKMDRKLGAANGYSKEPVPPTVAAARQPQQPNTPAPSLREKLEARAKAHEGK